MKLKMLTLNLAKLICILSWLTGLLWIGTESVDAHRVNVFAWVEGDSVFVESKFSGSKRVNAAEIIVTDGSGTQLLSGKTDENGKFSFKIPQKSDLKIVLLAGTGHRAEWTIAASEIAASAYGKKPPQAKNGTVQKLLLGMGSILGLTAIIAYVRKHRKKYLNTEHTKI